MSNKKKYAIIAVLALIIGGFVLYSGNFGFLQAPPDDDDIPPANDTPTDPPPTDPPPADPPSNPWDGINNGDLLGGESDNTVMGEGVNGLINPLDMSGIPTTSPGGEGCGLEALISTQWDYDNPIPCMGIQAMEGMRFSLFDSNGLAWTRTDPAPLGLGSMTGCGLAWNGVTQWEFIAEKTLGLFNCKINLEYDVKIVACNC